MAFFVKLILLFLLTSECYSEYFITRSNGEHGDELSGDRPLNCEDYGAIPYNENGYGSNTCICGAKKSYFTDRNGLSRCYEGIGINELGCFLHVKEPFEIVSFDSISVAGIVSMERKHSECNEGFLIVDALIWRNDKWEMFPADKLHLKSSVTTTTLPTGKELHETEFLIDRLSHTELEYLKGGMIKINYSVCGKITCLLIKFTGKTSWLPYHEQTISSTSSLSTKTSTSSLSTETSTSTLSTETSTSTLSTETSTSSSSTERPTEASFTNGEVRIPETSTSRTTELEKTTTDELFEKEELVDVTGNNGKKTLTQKEVILVVTTVVLGLLFVVILAGAVLLHQAKKRERIFTKKASSFGAPVGVKSSTIIRTLFPSKTNTGAPVIQTHRFLGDFFMSNNEDGETNLPASTI